MLQNTMILLSTRLKDREKVLTALDVASMSFFLTGSRYFSASLIMGREADGEEVDYDFYTQDSIGTLQLLMCLGFSVLNDPDTMDLTNDYDGDPNVSTVLRHPVGIDVQLVRDLAAKKFTQELLLYMAPLVQGKHTKDQARVAWNNAYEFYQQVQSGRFVV